MADTDTSIADKDDDEEREAKKHKTIDPPMEAAAAAAAATNVDDEELEVDSPLCEPYMITEELNNRYAHPEIHAAYQLAYAKYREKQNRMAKLPTYQYFDGFSCLSADLRLLPIRDTASNAVLSAAKFVLRLSSSIGGKPLTRSAGFWINWDEESKTGIVLTTAHLIRSKEAKIRLYPRSFGKDEHDPHAKVTVHLLDDTIADGRLLYHQEHYDLAFFEVRVDRPVPLPSFTYKVKNGQEAFRLGRDESLKLTITHGRVEYLNPNPNHRQHYMYFSQEKDDYKCDDDGGPIIDFDGNVIGMINNCAWGSFIPYSVLHGCLDLWRNFGCIPRPHLGLKFESIKLLDPVHVEYIWRKLNIDDGLIVQEVATRSPAEELGIRIGDIIECINGEHISTTIELENKLLIICKANFDKGNDINAKVDILVQVFHTGKRLRRTKYLTLKVSDCEDVVERAYYAITTGEGFSASVSPGQAVSEE